jgi:hypothetical protein
LRCPAVTIWPATIGSGEVWEGVTDCAGNDQCSQLSIA